MYGERLRNLRKRRHWTLDDVAKKLDMSMSTYAGYETKYRQPPIEKLIRMADLYNVSTDYILGISDDQERNKLDYDASEFLNLTDLTFNGVPLSNEDLKPIRELLDIVTRERCSKKHVEKKGDIMNCNL